MCFPSSCMLLAVGKSFALRDVPLMLAERAWNERTRCLKDKRYKRYMGRRR